MTPNQGNSIAEYLRLPPEADDVPLELFRVSPNGEGSREAAKLAKFAKRNRNCPFFLLRGLRRFARFCKLYQHPT